jgi:hypothetical protein
MPGEHHQSALGAGTQGQRLAAYQIGRVDHQDRTVVEERLDLRPGAVQQQRVTLGQLDGLRPAVAPASLHREDHQVGAAPHAGEHRLTDQQGPGWHDHLDHAELPADQRVAGLAGHRLHADRQALIDHEPAHPGGRAADHEHVVGGQRRVHHRRGGRAGLRADQADPGIPGQVYGLG